MNYPEHTKFLPDEERRRYEVEEQESKIDNISNEFEVVAVSQCDDCQLDRPLNHFGLCKECNKIADAFADAAHDAMLRGHDPYKAGMIAQAEIMRNKKRA